MTFVDEVNVITLLGLLVEYFRLKKRSDPQTTLIELIVKRINHHIAAHFALLQLKAKCIQDRNDLMFHGKPL